MTNAQRSKAPPRHREQNGVERRGSFATPRDVHVALGEHRSMQPDAHDNTSAENAVDRHNHFDSHW